MSTTTEYATDITKFTPSVDAEAVDTIVNYLGIALRNRDSALVSASDRKELERIRDGFAEKKLGLGRDAADSAIKAVVDRMTGDRSKNRVTFYYLLAETTGTLAKLHHN